MRSHKSFVVSVAVLTVLVLFALVTAARFEALQIDVESYKEQLAVLTERTTNYERLLEVNEELLAINEQLKGLNNLLSTRNSAIVRDNESLNTWNHELIAANDELERLNGDLAKKFDGLSELN